MRQILLTVAAFFLMAALQAQNLGVGTTEPLNKLHVEGSLLVNTPTSKTSTAPTAAQQKTIVNATNVTFASSDSTGRIYDPGGPAANYPANVTGFAEIFSTPNCIGIELTMETMQLGTGDSLIIRVSSLSQEILMAVGNGYSTTGKKIFNSGSLYFIFKSNADASTGTGFSLLFKRLYEASSSLPDVTGATGKALLFDVKKGSLKSGLINNEPHGTYATAFGYRTTASGFTSTAMGNGTTASENYSTAFGNNTTASGNSSIAMGGATVASALYSTAMGRATTANGANSTAMGHNTTANETSSTAMGFSTIADGIYSTAMGNDTWAIGNSSTAMGIGTIAYGTGSVAIGNSSGAEGLNSVAMGASAFAKGDNALAAGAGVSSWGFAGTAVGMYNNPVLGVPQTVVTSTTPLFMVGNGDNGTTRSNALIVLKNGNAGIGTNSPQTKLQVDGGTDASLTSTSGYMIIGDVSGTNVVFDNNEIMARNNGANTTLFLQNSGGAFEVGGTASKPGGGSWTAASDIRLKQNIRPYNDGLKQLLKINPVIFQYNSQSGYNTQQQHIGVIAQELRQTAPYMTGSFTRGNTEYLSVDNTAMTYMLINAVKEQQKQIEELKALLHQILKDRTKQP